jgi:hypothetical protein
MADEIINENSAGTDDTASDEGQVDKSTENEAKEESSDTAEDDGEIDFTALEPEVRTAQEIADDKAEEDDDSMDEDERKAIDSRIQKQLTPIQKQIQRQNDEIEVNGFLVDNPEYSKYKPAIMKFIGHSAYKNIPVSAIAAIVSSKDSQRIGAAKERAAAAKVKGTQAGGNQTRSNDAAGNKDIWAMNKQEWEAYKAAGLNRK